jgi:hypothetical protein
VESLTALVEETNGGIKLIQFTPNGEVARTLAVCGALDKQPKTASPCVEEFVEAVAV